MRYVVLNDKDNLDVWCDSKYEDNLKKCLEEQFQPTMNDKFIIETGNRIIKCKYKGKQAPLRIVNTPTFNRVKLDHEQQFVLDDLMDDDVKLLVVTGHAGTGKTFVSLLCALGMDYSEVIYTRENIEVGRSLGFLPGSVDEKFSPYMMGFYDNMNEIERMTQFHYRDAVRVEPVGYMRGGNIRNSVLIVDEAQNSELHTLKMLISRPTEDSKVILCGSFNQVDEKRLRKDGALLKVINAFHGQHVFSHTVLTQDKRSQLARLVDELLEE